MAAEHCTSRSAKNPIGESGIEMSLCRVEREVNDQERKTADGQRGVAGARTRKGMRASFDAECVAETVKQHATCERAHHVAT